MPLPAHWVNLRQESSLDVRDRGFAYGDGLFETLRCHNSRIHLQDHHLQRLQRGCERLEIDYPGDAVIAHFRAASAYLADHGIPDAVLRLSVSRGNAEDAPHGRGYGGAHGTPTVVMSLHAAALPWRDVPEPAQLIFYDRPLAGQPLLAGIKHCNRLEQVLAAKSVRRAGADEAIVSDQGGRVISGVSSNLFLVTGGRMITPSLKECGVAGTVRALVLEQLAADCMLTNSLIGIRSVACLGNHSYGPTPVADKLREQFFAHVDGLSA
jgi:4-amino-4-deoxychorismate lyase